MTQGTRKINACMTEQHKQKDTLQTLAEKTETEDGWHKRVNCNCVRRYKKYYMLTITDQTPAERNFCDENKRSWSHPQQNAAQNVPVMSIKMIKWPTATWRAPVPSSGHTVFVPCAEPYNTKQLECFHIRLNIFTRLSDFSLWDIWQKRWDMCHLCLFRAAGRHSVQETNKKTWILTFPALAGKRQPNLLFSVFCSHSGIHH